MKRANIVRSISIFAGLVLLSLLVYKNGLHIPYYADDYQRVFTNPSEAVSQAFTHANYSDASYRPLETISLGLIQEHWGWDTFPFRILNLFFHVLGAMLVFSALRFWKVGIWCSLLAAAFVIVSQMSAAAILGNDTQSQITGALFSALALWNLYRYLLQRNHRWRYLLSLAFFFLALLSKETSTGLVLAITSLIFMLQDEHGYAKMKKTLLAFLPFLLCFILYYALRIHAGSASPVFGDENLSLKLGANIPMNIGLFILQSILPVSSMAVMKALHYKDTLQLIVIFSFTIAFVLTVGYGILRSTRKGLLKVIAVLIFCSWFPAIILNHISELYSYNSIFLLALLFGISLDHYTTQLQHSTPPRVAISATIILFALISNAIGVDEKADSMRIQGERAAAFLPQIVQHAKQVPQGKWMYLAGPADSSFEYSMFAIHGFRVSSTSDSLVRFLAGRPDIRVYAADSAQCAESAVVHPGIRFTYDPATLRIYPFLPDSEFTGRK